MAALSGIVELTVEGMGYELVDLQLGNHGRQLRVFIDKAGGITVDHCAEISRQLSRVLEVEGIDYDRLEVSSPGLDRPLRKAADFARFAGSMVDVRMRIADAAGRKRFTGKLQGMESGVATVEVDGQPVALNLDEIDRARLAPEPAIAKGPRKGSKK